MKYVLLFLLLFTGSAYASGTPISALPSTTTTSGTELIPLVQSNITKQITLSKLLNQQTTLNLLNKTPIGSLAYYPVPCTGSGDEQAFLSTTPTADAAFTSMLIGNGCQTDNQWIIPQNSYTSVFGWGGGPTDVNTAGNIIPRITVFTPGIAANAPGQAAIDIHAPRQVTFNGVNIFGSDISQAATLIENSAQNGNCCATNTLDLLNSSLSNANTLVGCPMDGSLNCIQAGGIATGTITNGGTGYVNGTYNKVAFSGGSGTTAFADTITVSGGIVTSVVLNAQYWGYPGKNYVVGDTLSTLNSNLGGSGSGFVYTVNSIMRATPTAANTLVRATKDQFSDFGGCAFCLNTSDLMVYNSEFTGYGGIAIQPIFGGGGNQVSNNRFEFGNSSILFGGPNTAGAANGSTFVNNNFFTHTQSYDTAYRTTTHFDLSFGGGDGYLAVGNVFDENQTTDYPVILGGGPSALTNVAIVGNIFPDGFGGGMASHCVQIKNSSGSVTPDYIMVVGIICNNGTSTSPIIYTNTPVHMLEDTMGPGGEHWERGRSWGINTSSPPVGNNIFELAASQTTTGAILSLSNTTTGGGSLIVGSGGSSSLTLTTTGNVLTLANTSGTCTHTPGSSSETVSCSSDIKFKENIKRAPFFSGWLWDFHIKKYMLKATGEQTIGVIAQELQQNHPEMVHEAINPTTGETFLTVDQPNIWRLVKAIQELQLFAVIAFLVAIGSALYHLFHHMKYHRPDDDSV